MAVFSSDTFTDSDLTTLQAHTGEVGATWIQATDPADSVIDTNRIRADSDAFGHYAASGVPDSAEYDVEVDLFVKSTDLSVASAGCSGRLAANPGQDAYFVRYLEGTDWQLYKQDDGSFTLLGGYNQTLSDETAYAIKLEIRDAAKKLYIDSIERISSTDNVITAAGKAGITHDTTMTASTGYHIDNFVATDLSAGEGVELPERSYPRGVRRGVSRGVV